MASAEHIDLPHETLVGRDDVANLLDSSAAYTEHLDGVGKRNFIFPLVAYTALVAAFDSDKASIVEQPYPYRTVAIGIQIALRYTGRSVT